MQPKLTIILYGLILLSSIACRQQQDSNSSDAQNSEKSPSTENSDTTWTIEAQGIGIFQIGQPIPTKMEGYSIDKEEVVRETEEGPTNETLYLISKTNEQLFALQPDAQNTSQIGEIRIYSERYQTTEGVGVHATIADFTRAYPDYKLWYTYVSDRYVLETPQYPSVQFLLDEADYNGGKINVTSEITPLQVSDFEPDASIKMVRIF